MWSRKLFKIEVSCRRRLLDAIDLIIVKITAVNQL